jgi:hypothetical protein
MNTGMVQTASILRSALEKHGVGFSDENISLISDAYTIIHVLQK